MGAVCEVKRRRKESAGQAQNAPHANAVFSSSREGAVTLHVSICQETIYSQISFP